MPSEFLGLRVVLRNIQFMDLEIGTAEEQAAGARKPSQREQDVPATDVLDVSDGHRHRLNSCFGERQGVSPTCKPETRRAYASTLATVFMPALRGSAACRDQSTAPGANPRGNS